jgi:hypothetical protein
MTREQRGDFIDMLAASWDHDEPGTLPLPIEVAAKICGISARSCRKFVETFPKLWQIDGNRLVNPTLRAQWEQLRQLKQKQSDGARKTNQEYWKRPSVTDSVTDRSSSSAASAFAFASAKEGAHRPSQDTKSVAFPPFCDPPLLLKKNSPTERNDDGYSAGSPTLAERLREGLSQARRR